MKEYELKEVYVGMLCATTEYTRSQAEAAVSDAIQACKQEGEAEGTSGLPSDFGTQMLEAARMGEPKSRRIIEKAHRAGATDDDISDWWNLPDLARRMVFWSEDTLRHAVFLHGREDDGVTAERAAARAHRMFPIYGDPEDLSILSGEDRPLPNELRGRVDSYRQQCGADYITEQVAKFSSYNAFVRYAIAHAII